jgi:hypothetical protein
MRNISPVSAVWLSLHHGGEPSLGGFTGTLKYSGVMVFSPKFRRSFREESCLVFRHFQKELGRGSQRSENAHMETWFWIPGRPSPPQSCRINGTFRSAWSVCGGRFGGVCVIHA